MRTLLTGELESAVATVITRKYGCSGMKMYEYVCDDGKIKIREKE